MDVGALSQLVSAAAEQRRSEQSQALAQKREFASNALNDTKVKNSAVADVSVKVQAGKLSQSQTNAMSRAANANDANKKLVASQSRSQEQARLNSNKLISGFQKQEKIKQQWFAAGSGIANEISNQYRLKV